MAGRPRYEPTPADRNTVKIMAMGRFAHSEIAKCIGDVGIDEKTLRKHFRRELDVACTMANAKAVQKLHEAIEKGEAWAICFRLKAMAGWTDQPQQDGVGPGQVNIQLVVNRAGERERQSQPKALEPGDGVQVTARRL